MTAAPTAPTTGLVIDWRRSNRESGLLSPYGSTEVGPALHSGVVFANNFFIAGAFGFDESPAIWSSSDGITWELATVPDLREVSDLVAGSGALLAVGDPIQENTPLWLTTNGRDWERVVDTDFEGQRITRVGATGDGFVALGTMMWTSSDGREWQPAASPSGLQLAQSGVHKIARRGDQLVAIAGGQSATGAALEVWTSTDLMTWTRVATLPHSRRASHLVLATGPLGWLAAAWEDQAELRTFMWWSVDGVSWTEVSPGVGPVSDVFVDAVGFVAVGFVSTATGCAILEGEIQGLTWTSLDGQTWTTMPLEGFAAARIDHLFRNGRTLIGIGARYDEDDLETAIGSVWAAQLPQLPPAGPAPTPAPTPTPEPGGCGPG